MKTKFDKKDLKKRLSFVMMAQFDGLTDKSKEKIQRYLDEQLDDVASFYKDLLKKQKKKQTKETVSVMIAKHDTMVQQDKVSTPPVAGNEVI